MKPGTIINPDTLRAECYADPGRPLSRSLERALLDRCARMAPYRIEARIIDERDVPRTLSAIGGASTTLRDGAGALIGTRYGVSGLHSDRTIWSRPEVNALFRAWHDNLHELLCAGFDERGEYRVACASVAELATTPHERAILWAETWGQVQHYTETGSFPEDQRAFVAMAALQAVDEWEQSARKGGAARGRVEFPAPEAVGEDLAPFAAYLDPAFG